MPLDGTLVAIVAGAALTSLLLSFIATRFIRQIAREENATVERPYAASLGWNVIITLTTLFCALLIYQRFAFSSQAVAAWILASVLIVLSFIDLRTFYLPDILTRPLILLGIGQGALGLFTTLETALIGAAVGYGAPWLINKTFKLIRKKEGMGGGDFKLLAALGAWAGWAMLPLILFFASLLGLIFALIGRVGRQEPFPFGPALALAGIICLCYGNEALAWYMKLTGN